MMSSDGLLSNGTFTHTSFATCLIYPCLFPHPVENNLMGSLPAEITELVSLRELYLSNNTLTGNFPESLSSLRLSEIDVEENSMSGNPFDVLTKIPTLSRLRISRNGFSGEMPPSIAVWDRMVEFWIAENDFSGPLVKELGEMVNLQTLFVYDNQFTGPLPAELGNLRLFAFQAQNNRLSGNIPVQFYNNVDMTFLRLDANQLSGPLTGAFGRMTELQDLRLANNTFSGALPPSIYGLNKLRKCFGHASVAPRSDENISTAFCLVSF